MAILPTFGSPHPSCEQRVVVVVFFPEKQMSVSLASRHPVAASRPRCPRVSELGARGQRAMSPMVRAQRVCAQRSEPGLNPPGSEAKGMGRLFCCQGGPMGGKQGIHSENCISWQAASHADLVLDCRNGRAERMPGSVMLNPVPGGLRGTVCGGHEGHWA